jgi:hypothetical protein
VDAVYDVDISDVFNNEIMYESSESDVKCDVTISESLILSKLLVCDMFVSVGVVY